VRAFFKTLLLYVIVGPLVGLLSLVLLSVPAIAWDLIAHWLQALVPHAQSEWCQHQIPPNLDLRCFQRVEPFHFSPHIVVPGLQTLSGLVLAVYAVGLIPAAFAGLLVSQARLVAGHALRFWHVLALGCLVGVILSAIIGANYYLHGAHFFRGCAFLVYMCAFATIICWLPARRWWLERELDG
jgi:hypothetical protein